MTGLSAGSARDGGFSVEQVGEWARREKVKRDSDECAEPSSSDILMPTVYPVRAHRPPTSMTYWGDSCCNAGMQELMGCSMMLGLVDNLRNMQARVYGPTNNDTTRLCDMVTLFPGFSLNVLSCCAVLLRSLT